MYSCSLGNPIGKRLSYYVLVYHLTNVGYVVKSHDDDKNKQSQYVGINHVI